MTTTMGWVAVCSALAAHWGSEGGIPGTTAIKTKTISNIINIGGVIVLTTPSTSASMSTNMTNLVLRQTLPPLSTKLAAIVLLSTLSMMVAPPPTLTIAITKNTCSPLMKPLHPRPLEN